MTNENENKSSWITRVAAAGIASLSAFSAQQVDATTLDVSDVPLYVVQGVEPNIILTMDDSGSMAWSFMPDSIYGYYNTKRAKSSTFNVMYYNPAVQYLPPMKADGTSFPNASFTGAWKDGYNTSAGTVNLSTSFRPTWYYSGYSTAYAGSAEAAYYYKYGSGSTNSDSSYSKVVVSTTSGPGGSNEKTNFANWYSYYRTRQLLAKSAASRAFANLNDHVRVARQALNNSTTINTLAKFTGTGRSAFFSWLYNVDASGGTPLLRAFERAGDEYTQDDPYRDDPSSSSSTMRSCRQNFHVAMTDGYWNGSYGVSGNKDGGSSTYTLPTNSFGITTYSPMHPYEDSNSSNAADNAFYYWVRDLKPTLTDNVPTYIVRSNGDFDGDGTAGEPEDIFWDPQNDPANWQHMVNFTVGLGVNGNLSYPADYNALVAGTKDWGTTNPDVAANVDDLWHAAVNSRGQYFSAADPQALVDAFSDVLNSITDRTGSAAPLALNAGTVSSNTKVFQVRFNTGDWTGELRALPISDGTGNATCTTSDPLGTVCATPVWEAGCALDGGSCVATGTSFTGLNWNSGRKIVTYNPATGAGVPFRWASLDSSSGSQRALLNASDGQGQARVDFVRGDHSCEAGNTASCGYDLNGDSVINNADKLFRNRNSLLGDMINSNPVYVGAPLRVYPSSLESSSYTAFRTANQNRNAMVYAGANDGMLHGFDATTGVEKLAYVPNAVFRNIPALSSSSYGHKSFADGPLVEGDIFYSAAWHTALVGGLGLGGQAVFSLDITDPSAFSESNAATIVKWEFSDSDDADLGYTTGKPVIVRLNTGKWAAIFGNGYNNTDADGHVSATGNAVLYIVDIETGSLIKKLDSGVGTAQDPTGNGRPNGLGTVTAVDVNQDFKTDYIYAGDVFGNVWKFDLCSLSTTTYTCGATSASAFKVAYDNGASPAVPEPVYTAEDASGNHQPITTAITVGFHPSGNGLMLYFGTGKYLGVSDLTDTSQQTFYGIWDKGTYSDLPADRDDLLQQSVIETNSTAFTGVDARLTTKEDINWYAGSGSPSSGYHLGWYLDLSESGERVHQDPMLRSGRVIFVTVTPSTDPCATGGTSWLMELDAASGARLNFSPFDYDNDGSIAAGDFVLSTTDINGDGTIDSRDHAPGSGIRQQNGGILTSPAILMLPQDEKKMMSTSNGAIISVGEEDGREARRSWRQVR